MLTIAIVQICERLPKMRVARDLEIGSSKESPRSQAKRSTGWRDLERNESYGNQNSDATRLESAGRRESNPYQKLGKLLYREAVENNVAAKVPNIVQSELRMT
jgi:hypothetical protein